MDWKFWVFLDIDGVLATNKTYSAWQKHREDWKLIDEKLLRNFKELLDYIPNYEFCLSSSWRMNEQCRKELFKAFRTQKVPRWRHTTNLERQTWRNREILDFCLDNIQAKDRLIILDDFPMDEPEDCPELVPFHIRSDNHTGFNKSLLKAAKAIVDREMAHKDSGQIDDWTEFYNR